MKWWMLILGIACNASASVLVKVAMLPPWKFPSVSDPWAVLSNFPFWLGLALYGGAFLFYAESLVRLPLNVAQPILTSGAIATVSILSFAVFREPFYWTTIAGIVLVILGVILIASHAA